MIERLADLPGQVVRFVASGQVTASEHETVIAPAIESAPQGKTGRSHSLPVGAAIHRSWIRRGGSAVQGRLIHRRGRQATPCVARIPVRRQT
jgi:hypothetical protein